MASVNPDELRSQVELFIACRDIPSKDTFSKSDPMAVLSQLNPATKKWSVVGQTEMQKDNENPVFKKKFSVPYYFEEVQTFKIDVYDVDSDNLSNYSEHDYLGFVVFQLGQLMAARGCVLDQPMNKKTGEKRTKARIIVRGDELKNSQDFAHVQFSCRNLEKMDFFGKSDPYITLHRVRDDNTEVQVHQTEMIKKTLDPDFQPFVLNLESLCGCDYKRDCIIRVWDWDSATKSELIGEVRMPVGQLFMQDQAPPVSITLFRKNKEKPKNDTKVRGTLIVKRFFYFREHTFLDYLKGGLNMALMVAIDFTASNGDVRDPRSLHYLGAQPNGQVVMNQYETAIDVIGRITSVYSEHKEYAAFGFGGEIPTGPTTRGVSHCFPLTLDANKPTVTGVEGILSAYRQSFRSIRLSGPTYFSELVQTANAITSKPYSPDFYHYTILLIITDGVINDLNKAIDSIVAASDKPLSIIIVGVGAADFAAMDALDSDDKALTDGKGNKAKRDIVQFVPFRQFMNMDPSLLAKHTLAEVPQQVVSFMKLHKIPPLQPRQAAPMDQQAAGGAPGAGAAGAGAGAGEYKASDLQHMQQQQQQQMGAGAGAGAGALPPGHGSGFLGMGPNTAFAADASCAPPPPYSQ